MTDTQVGTLADLNVTAAVFGYGKGRECIELVLVHLEADASETMAAEVTSRGYDYLGYCAVVNGVPRVHIEPGDRNVEAMAYAGVLFAEMLGPMVKDLQLTQR